MTGAQLLKELYYIVLWMGDYEVFGVYMKEKGACALLVAELKEEGIDQFLILHEGTRHYMKRVKGEWMYAKVKKHPYLNVKPYIMWPLQEYRDEQEYYGD